MTTNRPAKNQVRGAHMVSSGYLSAWADDKNVAPQLRGRVNDGTDRSSCPEPGP